MSTALPFRPAPERRLSWPNSNRRHEATSAFSPGVLGLEHVAKARAILMGLAR